jgi:hypothetical protein
MVVVKNPPFIKSPSDNYKNYLKMTDLMEQKGHIHFLAEFSQAPRDSPSQIARVYMENRQGRNY